jgi:membrane protein YqaA with SNARE-associated domain
MESYSRILAFRESTIIPYKPNILFFPFLVLLYQIKLIDLILN